MKVHNKEWKFDFDRRTGLETSHRQSRFDFAADGGDLGIGGMVVRRMLRDLEIVRLFRETMDIV
jgi:hypothetical protein